MLWTAEGSIPLGKVKSIGKPLGNAGFDEEGLSTYPGRRRVPSHWIRPKVKENQMKMKVSMKESYHYTPDGGECHPTR